MKRILNGLIMSLSMFSIIPMPQTWDADSFCWVIPAFPLVGLLIGCLWFFVAFFITWAELPTMFCAALVTLFPIILSGFIHMDGYMDTSDAIFSRTGLEKKRKILDDPSTGAFAVIMMALYMLLAFASVYSGLDRGAKIIDLIFIPVMSRGVSGIALLNVKPISRTGLGASFRKNTKPIHTTILLFYCTICLIVGVATGGLTTLCILLALMTSGYYATNYVTGQLDGISGDLCGFIITISELCAIIAWALI